ncbi:MAG: serine hydrolase domain-containing protein [Pseudomonadota bacterium]
MTDFTRRALLASAPFALAPALTGCAFSTVSGPSRATADVALRTLIGEGERRALPAAGFVVMKNGEVLASAAAGDAVGLDPTEGVSRRPFTVETPFRAASISKMVVALTALEVARDGGLDLDGDMQAVFPALARNPAFGETPITMRQLLAHTSTITDPEAYWVAAPGDVRGLINGDLYRAEGLDGAPLAYGPGDWFEYANINYGLAATALELVTGQRFDLLAAERVLLRLGMDAGFNWSGVSSAKRRAGATLYRKFAEGWRVQTDGPDVLAGTGPFFLSDGDYDLSDYEPGTNGTLFGPQGGLRANLVDLARLAGAVGRTETMTEEVWRLNADGSNGDHLERIFQSFGTGVFLHEASVSAWPGQTMIGHHGEAYGLYAGAWHLPQKGIELAYAVTGTPDGIQPGGGIHPAFNVWEQALVNIARATVS